MSGSDEVIACSLSADEMRVRGGEARRLMERALIRSDQASEGVRLVFRRSAGVEDAVRDLVRREQECCPFFEFAIDAEAAELELRMTAPPQARELLDGLFGLGAHAGSGAIG